VDSGVEQSTKRALTQYEISKARLEVICRSNRIVLGDLVRYFIGELVNDNPMAIDVFDAYLRNVRKKNPIKSTVADVDEIYDAIQEE